MGMSYLPNIPYPQALYAENCLHQTDSGFELDTNMLWMSQGVLSSPRNATMLNSALPSALITSLVSYKCSVAFGSEDFSERDNQKYKASCVHREKEWVRATDQILNYEKKQLEK